MADAEKIIDDRERLYTLSYRKGGRVETKHFPFKGPLGKAMERGREHCKIMQNIKFVSVTPLVVDLDHQEKIKGEQGYFDWP